MRIDKGLAAFPRCQAGRHPGARQFRLLGEHGIGDRQLVDDLEFEPGLVVARQRHQFIDARLIGAAVDAVAGFAGHDDELRAGAVDADAQLFQREGIELAERCLGFDEDPGVHAEQVDAQVGARHQRGDGGVVRGAAGGGHAVGDAHAGQGAQRPGELLALAFQWRIGGGEKHAEILRRCGSERIGPDRIGNGCRCGSGNRRNNDTRCRAQHPAERFAILRAQIEHRGRPFAGKACGAGFRLVHAHAAFGDGGIDRETLADAVIESSREHDRLGVRDRELHRQYGRNAGANQRGGKAGIGMQRRASAGGAGVAGIEEDQVQRLVLQPGGKITGTDKQLPAGIILQHQLAAMGGIEAAMAHVMDDVEVLFQQLVEQPRLARPVDGVDDNPVESGPDRLQLFKLTRGIERIGAGWVRCDGQDIEGVADRARLGRLVGRQGTDQRGIGDDQRRNIVGAAHQFPRDAGDPVHAILFDGDRQADAHPGVFIGLARRRPVGDQHIADIGLEQRFEQGNAETFGRSRAAGFGRRGFGIADAAAAVLAAEQGGGNVIE